MLSRKKKCYHCYAALAYLNPLLEARQYILHLCGAAASDLVCAHSPATMPKSSEPSDAKERQGNLLSPQHLTIPIIISADSYKIFFL